AHLALFLVGAAALIWGLTQTLPLTSQLASHPAGAALDTLGVLLLLAALIWEIVDLGRIDHEVYQRNLLLAEGIIAGNLLDDHSGVDAALQRAEAATHGGQAAAGAAAVGAAGVITAHEVADARALAEEHGGAGIAYSEVSTFDVSADPDAGREAAIDARHESWADTATTHGVIPSATPNAAPTPYTDTTIHTHTEDGPRVTDTYEVDRAPEASAGEIAGLGAAGLGAAALGAEAFGAAHASAFDEPTQPDLSPVFPPDEAPDAASFDLGDVTDASMPAVVPPAADIAFHNAAPAWVDLPDEQFAPLSQEAPERPLTLTPEEPQTDTWQYPPEPVTQPAWPAPASVEPAPEAYVPPVPSVFSAPVEPPAAPPSPWDQPTETQPQPMRSDALAEAAGAAGVVGAGALAADAIAHHHEPEPAPEPAPAPEPPKPRRIRVKREAVLDGKVVGEMVVLADVLPGETPQQAFDRVQAEMAHYSPEQIARAANLSPDDDVQVRQGELRQEG
ncbi:MAG: hypothetical protein KGO05_09435, partial [Chloroflexota bacterium]|nr:hypothetical protein [Chloroflexota bacterium]